MKQGSAVNARLITAALFWTLRCWRSVWFHALPNGLRYPLVGGTRQRRFGGTNIKPRKPPENAHAVPTGCSPTTMALALFAGDRVHALLGALTERKTHW